MTTDVDKIMITEIKMVSENKKKKKLKDILERCLKGSRSVFFLFIFRNCFNLELEKMLSEFYVFIEFLEN